LGDARATEMGERGELNVGQLVRERHGDNAVLVGFSTYTGTVTAASNWDAPAERKQVRPALRDSYEALLHEVGIPRFQISLREPAAVARYDRHGWSAPSALSIVRKLSGKATIFMHAWQINLTRCFTLITRAPWNRWSAHQSGPWKKSTNRPRHFRQVSERKEWIMPTQEIPRAQWATFLDTFTQQHEGWLATLEVFAPDLARNRKHETFRLKALLPPRKTAIRKQSRSAWANLRKII